MIVIRTDCNIHPQPIVSFLEPGNSGYDGPVVLCNLVASCNTFKSYVDMCEYATGNSFRLHLVAAPTGSIDIIIRDSGDRVEGAFATRGSAVFGVRPPVHGYQMGSGW